MRTCVVPICIEALWCVLIGMPVRAQARAAARQLSRTTTEHRNAGVCAMAEALLAEVKRSPEKFAEIAARREKP